VYELFKRPVRKKDDAKVIKDYEKVLQKKTATELMHNLDFDQKLLFIALLNNNRKPDILLE
jgi:hypothetical protein